MAVYKFLLVLALAKISSSHTNVEDRLDQLEQENTRLRDALKEVQDKQNLLLKAQQAPVKVAFTAECQENIGPNQGGTIVRFSRTITNVGNAYDTSRYTFKAPAKGIYAFQWNIYGEEGNKTPCSYLTLNGNWVISANIDRSDYHSAGNMAVLQLNAGDETNIRLTNNDCGVFLDSNNGILDRANSFTGFLVDTN